MYEAPPLSTRLYVGNLPPDVTKEELLTYFTTGPGSVLDAKIVNGYGFVEYDSVADARDALSHFHGADWHGSRLTVQPARGARPREHPPSDRNYPRPRRSVYRMSMSGLPVETSWQDLKDFARISDVEVVYSEMSRDRDGKGFVEFETGDDLKAAVDKLDNTEYKGAAVHCYEDIQSELPARDRYRSRSPAPYRRGGGYGGSGPGDYYGDRRAPPPPRASEYDDGGRRGAPGGYGAGYGYPEERHSYRRRSPPPRDDYYGGHAMPPPESARGGYSRGGYRSPPRSHRGPPPDDGYSGRPRGPPRGPPMDDGYGPPPRGGPRGPPLDDAYPPPRSSGYARESNGYGPPPRRGGAPANYEDPYPPGGYGRGGRRSPPPPPPGRGSYSSYGGYEDRPRGY